MSALRCSDSGLVPMMFLRHCNRLSSTTRRERLLLRNGWNSRPPRRSWRRQRPQWSRLRCRRLRGLRREGAAHRDIVLTMRRGCVRFIVGLSLMSRRASMWRRSRSGPPVQPTARLRHQSRHEAQM